MDRLGVFGQWFGSHGRHTRRHGKRAGVPRPAAGGDDGIAVMLSCLTAQARRGGREAVATPTTTAAPTPPQVTPEGPPAGGVGLWPAPSEVSPAIATTPDHPSTDPAWSGPTPVFVPHDWADAPAAAAPVALSVCGNEVTFTMSAPELAPAT